MMNVVELIERKRDGGILARGEIQDVIAGFTAATPAPKVGVR